MTLNRCGTKVPSSRKNPIDSRCVSIWSRSVKSHHLAIVRLLFFIHDKLEFNIILITTVLLSIQYYLYFYRFKTRFI
jgi:hypothetical protein